MTSILRLLLLACPLLTAPLAACDPEADDPPSRIAEHRTLARAHAEGRALDRLAADQLLVDPRLEVEVDQVRLVLVPGALADDPLTLADLRAAPELRGKRTRETLLGGRDAARPAIFDDVAAGTYTVCVVVGPPRDPALDTLTARALAHYEADGGGELSGEKLMAAVDRARAETGVTPAKIAWDPLPLLCRSIEVTADLASRTVDFAEL